MRVMFTILLTINFLKEPLLHVFMMFCPKCGSLMMPTEDAGKKFLACKCGYSNKKAKTEMKETVDNQKEEVKVLDGEASAHPIVEANCPTCGLTQAEFWSLQTRSSDEPETQFFRCQKCKKTWKE